MIKIIRPRASGKTTDLLKYAQENGCDILTATHPMAMCILDTAIFFGLADKNLTNVRFSKSPISFGDVRIFAVSEVQRGLYDGLDKSRPVLIDDLDAVLCRLFPRMNIVGFSITDDSEDGT